MNLRSLRSALFAVATTVLVPVALSAQAAPATTTVVTPAFDFSGVVFGAYGIRTDSAAKATLGGKSPNPFTLDRAYLTFRMPAGDNASIRVTTDVFQQTNAAAGAFYGGWVVRIKYGYVQYTGLRDEFGKGSNLTGRIGILHTVVIDHEEQFWPRYLSQVALERNGFMVSADGGAAGLLTLGNKWGEVYGTVVNGGGYTAVERDRFKDFALRLSLTPLASHDNMSPILKSFAITPWFSKGWNPSTFAAGGAGQVGPGTTARSPTVCRRTATVSSPASRNAASPPAPSGPSGRMRAMVRRPATPPRFRAWSPIRRVVSSTASCCFVRWSCSTRRKKSGLQLIGRFDHFTPNTDPTAANYAGSTPSYNYWVLGGSYDVTSRFTLALDWQVQNPTSFPTASRHEHPADAAHVITVLELAGDVLSNE